MRSAEQINVTYLTHFILHCVYFFHSSIKFLLLIIHNYIYIYINIYIYIYIYVYINRWYIHIYIYIYVYINRWGKNRRGGHSELYFHVYHCGSKYGYCWDRLSFHTYTRPVSLRTRYKHRSIPNDLSSYATRLYISEFR